MKTNQKRIISLLLALMMCLSVFVITPTVADSALNALAAGTLSLKSNSGLVIDGDYLRGVGEETSVATVIGKFSSSNISVYSADGKQITSSALVGTGSTVSLIENGSKVDTLTVVVLGDVNGDAVVDATDYLVLKSVFLGRVSLEGAKFSAGDSDGNNIIDSTDYAREKSFFLGTYEFPTPDDSSEGDSGVDSETKTNYALNKNYSTSGSFLDGKADNGKLITDGVHPNAEATNATLAFAGTGATSSITVNLNAKYVDINEIVVSGVAKSGNRQYAAVTIEVSTNGVSFTKLSGYTVSSTEYAGNMFKYAYKLASEVTAKYVKITFVSESYVLTVGEIEVYGGNASVSPEPTPTPMPTDDKLYIAKTGGLWEDCVGSDGVERCKDSNATHLAFPGTYVGGMYYYKILALYDANVNGYVVSIAAASHRYYEATVPDNGIGLIFYFNPGDLWGRNFAMEQYKVWTKIRPGDILRPHGIDVANRSLDLSGAIHPNNNLVTNAYFAVEYAERNVPQTLYNDKTIVALGDSITENGGWVESVSDLIGTTIINSGISGNRTTECLARFDRDVAAYNPDIVLIMLGINDVIQWYYDESILATYKRELGELYDRCTAIGAEVVFMCPNDINIASLDYSRYAPYGGLGVVFPQFISAMKSVAASKGCHVIDIYTPFHNTGNVKGHLIDTVHPNDYGYEIFKETIANYLLANQESICGGSAVTPTPTPDPTPMPTDDKLYIAKTGGLWVDCTDSDGVERCTDSNATHLAFPGTYVGGLYYYKILALYDANVDGYVVSIAAASHRFYETTVPSNGIGLIFNFNPGDLWGRNFAMEQYKVWTKIRPGDILRPHGINVANGTLDLSGAIHPNNNLVTNAYFAVEYAQRNVPQTLYNDKTIVALGDSITENGGWVESVSDLIGTTIINSGISGHMTTDCLARFDRDVAAHNPDIVLIMLGINDAIQWYYDDTIIPTYKRELGQLYDKCAAIGAKVVFMCPNDINIAALDYSRYAPYGGLGVVFPQFISAMKSVAASKGCHVIDIYTPFHNTGNVKGHLIDTVHPNDYGYEIFKETIANYLLANQASICG